MFDNVNPGDRGGDRRRSPTHRRPTCAERSTPPDAPSTRPRGRPTTSFRQRCLLQLQEALEREQEELREELILEVGCPRMVTHGPQLDAPLDGRPALPGRAHRRLPVGGRPRRRDGRAHRHDDEPRRVWREPVGVVGAIVPWNYPFEVMIHKVGQALATGNTLVVKPAPRHAVQRHAPRSAGRRADRHPRRAS